MTLGDVASGLPPGPQCPPRLQALALATRFAPWLERCNARYGDAFTLRTGHHAAVVLAHPDAIGQVLLAKAETVRTHKARAGEQSLFGERSLLFSDGDRHLALRRSLLPSFHRERLGGYASAIGERMQEEVAQWPTGEPLALWPRLHSVAIDVIVNIVFGRRQPTNRSLLAELISKRATGRLQEALLSEVRRRRRAPEDRDRDGVLGALLAARSELGEPLVDEEVRDQALTILIAGQEPSAIAACWAMERLTRHPEKLERLRREVATGEAAYLEAVVKEVLRTRPPVPLINRVLEEPTEIAGYRLPAGTSVAPSPLLVQRRTDVYPEPGRFEPERFLGPPPPANTWIPFGAGPHRCVGAGLTLIGTKEIVRAIVSQCRMRPVRPEPERMTPVLPNLRPSSGAEVVIDEHLPS